MCSMLLTCSMESYFLLNRVLLSPSSAVVHTNIYPVKHNFKICDTRQQTQTQKKVCYAYEKLVFKNHILPFALRRRLSGYFETVSFYSKMKVH